VQGQWTLAEAMAGNQNARKAQGQNSSRGECKRPGAAFHRAPGKTVHGRTERMPPPPGDDGTDWPSPRVAGRVIGRRDQQP
jgi:hypothetical protein